MGLLDELGGNLGCLRAGRIRRLRREWCDARGLRVGVQHVSAQPRGTEYDDEAMFLDRLDEYLDAGNLHLAQLNGQRRAFLAFDAAGAAVADQSLGVQRAKISARGNVIGSQFETNARRLERPAADHVLQRVVTEQRQMSGTAARSDAGLDRNAEARHTAPRKHIEPRRLRRLEFGQAARLEWQAPQPIGDHHDDLRIVARVQAARQLMHIHTQFLDLELLDCPDRAT